MELKIEREFSFKKCLNDKYEKWTNDVLDSLENKELMIFDAKDENPFSNICSYEKIDQFIEERTKEKINICDYLPLACQCVRNIQDSDIELKKEQEEKKVLLASYWSNTNRTILPVSSILPESPAAFIGEIVLHDLIEDKLRPHKPKSEEPFKYIMAHELLHVFNGMRIIVPAFRDWKNFWAKALKKGQACSDAREVKKRIDNDIDDPDKVIMELEKYWPSKAEKWFNAFRSLNKNNKND